jgi:CDP-6-deoxy-D-xylo-4-hexulose-3-dehydrase
LQAAIGVAQLDKLTDFTAKRKANYARLYEGLKDLPELEIFTALPEADPAWFGFLMTVTGEAKFSRNDMTEYLEKNLIQTRNLFAGNLLKHPCFETLQAGVDYRVTGDLPVTEKIMNNSFWIGLYPGMTEEKLDYMITTIRKFCKNS